MNRVVPFFDYPRLYLDHRETILEVLEDVGSRGAFIMQRDLESFERSLERFTGASHAVGVANATDGLELIWLTVGLKPGDEVIVSSHTMLATASAIVTAGGTPVPVDIGPDNLIDPDAIEAAVTSRTVGISPTHLNGRTCDMERIMSIAARHSLEVVEDAAQALGSRFKGQHAGTFGLGAAISFFPAKVLGALGDAGGVITNNKSAFRRIVQLHDHGRDTDGEVRGWGRNSRLDNFQAAVLNVLFPDYERVIERRRTIASMYEEQLSDLEQLRLPPSPDSSPDHFDVYQNYELDAERRDDLRSHLAAHGVGTLIQWGGTPIHRFSNLGFHQDLPGVDRFFERCIMLPINMFIDDNDVDYVCTTVRDFYRS